jgi:hypothetical protein
MRILVEIFVVGVLIYIGWATQFRDYLPASIQRRCEIADATACCSDSAAAATAIATNCKIDIYSVRRLDVGPKPPFSVR